MSHCSSTGTPTGSVPFVRKAYQRFDFLISLCQAILYSYNHPIFYLEVTMKQYFLLKILNNKLLQSNEGLLIFSFLTLMLIASFLMQKW